MKNALLIIALVFAGQVSAQQALGEVTGYVFEYNSKMGALDAKIVIDDIGSLYQAKADIDGSFRISAIPAGIYLVDIYYQGDTMQNIQIEVPMNGIARMGDINFDGGVQKLGPINVIANRDEIVMIDGNLPVKEISAKEIAKSPAKFDLKALITSISSNVQQAADGSLTIRGARKGDMIYMVDGIKVRGDAGQIPSAGIGYMQVYTGGLPAKYGDTLGGVVVIESKSYFDLYRAWEAEQIRNGKM